MEEYFGEPLQKLRRQIEALFAFQIVLARTEVGGYCSHCQAMRAREMREAAEELSVPAKKTTPVPTRKPRVKTK